MKKIMHFITGLERGGAEQMLLKILPKLQTAELKNSVVCIKGHGIIGSELQRQGVPVHYLGYRHFYDLPRIVWIFFKLLKKEKPTILVTYLIHADLLGRVLAKFARVPIVIAYLHGSLLHWQWLRNFDRLTQRWVTRYLSVSETLKQELVTHYKFPKEKIRVLRNGIDAEQIQRLTSEGREKVRRKLGFKKEDRVIGIVANLRKGKGHPDLIEAFHILLQKESFSSSLQLMIVGDGSERESLERQVQALNLIKQIHFLGNRSDVQELLTAMDLFVLPTEFEGMSVALLEAMMVQTPIVTTDIPQNKEILTHGVSALLVPIKNPQELAQAIRACIEDPEASAHRAQNAYRRCIKEFSLEHTIKTFEKVLLETV
jgi:glycosyltransferase involved in cell wall biosynthesis